MRLRETTVGGELGPETLALSRREIVHAAIVAVVHIIVETVDQTHVREQVMSSSRATIHRDLRIRSLTGTGIT